jgi:hypothetical protein
MGFAVEGVCRTTSRSADPGALSAALMSLSREFRVRKTADHLIKIKVSWRDIAHIHAMVFGRGGIATLAGKCLSVGVRGAQVAPLFSAAGAFFL